MEATEFQGVEKRKSGDRRADCTCGKESEIDLLFAERDRTQTFRGQAKIAGIVALAIFGASFLYTYTHIRASTRMSNAIYSGLKSEDDKLHRIANKANEDISDMKSDVAVGNDRYIRLLVDIGKVERKVDAVIDLISKERTYEGN